MDYSSSSSQVQAPFWPVLDDFDQKWEPYMEAITAQAAARKAVDSLGGSLEKMNLGGKAAAGSGRSTLPPRLAARVAASRQY